MRVEHLNIKQNKKKKKLVLASYRELFKISKFRSLCRISTCAKAQPQLVISIPITRGNCWFHRFFSSCYLPHETAIPKPTKNNWFNSFDFISVRFTIKWNCIIICRRWTTPLDFNGKLMNWRWWISTITTQEFHYSHFRDLTIIN